MPSHRTITIGSENKQELDAAWYTPSWVIWPPGPFLLGPAPASIQHDKLKQKNQKGPNTLMTHTPAAHDAACTPSCANFSSTCRSPDVLLLVLLLPRVLLLVLGL
jgi:hypothetical protein